MVIHGVVQEGACPGPAVLPALSPSKGPVTATLLAASELFDVDADQVSGVFVFVTLWCRLRRDSPVLRPGRPACNILGLFALAAAADPALSDVTLLKAQFLNGDDLLGLPRNLYVVPDFERVSATY